VLNIVTGPGGSTGNALAGHPGVDKIAFTGETTTGVSILQQAAPNITRVSLELGGKSPNIVFADADLEKAAAGAVGSVFANAGQDCLCSKPCLRGAIDCRGSSINGWRPVPGC